MNEIYDGAGVNGRDFFSLFLENDIKTFFCFFPKTAEKCLIFFYCSHLHHCRITIIYFKFVFSLLFKNRLSREKRYGVP